MANVSQQTLDDPISLTEDVTVVVGPSAFTTSPAAWDVSFLIWNDPQDTPVEVDAGSPVVTGSYVATWTVVIPAAGVATLRAGLLTWRLERQDAGDVTVLARGTVLGVKDP